MERVGAVSAGSQHAASKRGCFGDSTRCLLQVLLQRVAREVKHPGYGPKAEKHVDV